MWFQISKCSQVCIILSILVQNRGVFKHFEWGRIEIFYYLIKNFMNEKFYYELFLHNIFSKTQK